MLRFLFDYVAGDGINRRIYNGYGSPEGSVVADQGSIYMRGDGGTTTSVYIKTSGGLSATGWTAK